MVKTSTGKKKKPHTEEAKEKMRLAKIGYIPWNADKQMEKYECQYCGIFCDLLSLKKMAQQ